jgi:hypothetical protein
VTCVERPRSSSVSRLAQADLRQCGADPGVKLSPGLPSVRLSRLSRFDTDGLLISWSDACRSSRAAARSLMSMAAECCRSRMPASSWSSTLGRSAF